MQLKFYNTPKPAKMEQKNLPANPKFIEYRPNFKLITKLANKYSKYKNILIIGHGGSTNSLIGMYSALQFQAKKNLVFLTTVDPDYIHDIKKEYKPKDTVVISISKSGENITQLESTNQFIHYPLIIMTESGNGLAQIAEKINAEMVTHPDMYGRFAGFTEVALLPAAIAGLDIQGLFDGAQDIYKNYKKDNDAWKAASVLWQLEQKGIVDVYMPFYSHYLFPLSNIVVQLCHESFGKNGKGQTYFAAEGPEAQHHTNQRFFGGRKNVAGFFTSSENFLHQSVSNYPKEILDVSIKQHKLSEINNIALDRALQYELAGTLQDAQKQGIPLLWQTIDGFSAKEIGKLIAFWQLYAVYASSFRKVNPFDQPQVENSKKISFSSRLADRK